MNRVDLAILGGGAAGLMAACTAAGILGKRGSVLLLEGNQKLGKKLLATGNGRCNLSNENVGASHYHGDTGFLDSFLSTYSVPTVLQAFRRMGLLTRADDAGRIYPYNQQAAAVLGTLCRTAEERGVVLQTEAVVTGVQKQKAGFVIALANGETVHAKACILAFGGKASPKHSCAENGYQIAESLGHPCTPLCPALTQLQCRGKIFKSIAGMRSGAEVTLLADGKPVYRERGEVQFTETGISGICVFGVSVYAAALLHTGKLHGVRHDRTEVAIDLLPDWSFDDLKSYLQEICHLHPNMAAADLFSGVLNLRVGTALVRESGIDAATPLCRVRPGELSQLTAAVKRWKIPVTGTKGWQEAQVTAGGVPMSGIHPETMESKSVKGLYFTGELINVHGDCGGYNLHFAWATGMAAGIAAAKLLEKERTK